MNSKYTLLIILLVPGMLLLSCTRTLQPQPTGYELLRMNPGGKGQELTIEFTRGKAHNHPLMAVWLEGMDSSFIQTLYVAESIGKGVFDHASARAGKWAPGEIRRPAALPYWGHRRGIKADDGLYLPTPSNPVPDAYTGPTPTADFVLITRADNPLPTRFRVFFEINQPWDWNEYWTNNKFLDNEDYKTSSQPSLIYMTEVDLEHPRAEYDFRPMGHGHYSGATCKMDPDLTTLTTALYIASSIKLKINP